MLPAALSHAEAVGILRRLVVLASLSFVLHYLRAGVQCCRPTDTKVPEFAVLTSNVHVLQ